ADLLEIALQHIDLFDLADTAGQVVALDPFAQYLNLLVGQGVADDDRCRRAMFPDSDPARAIAAAPYMAIRTRRVGAGSRGEMPPARCLLPAAILSPPENPSHGTTRTA
ncbi:hypothetical protein OMR07_26975, partial [Methylobacterium organophilum]|nr:hypothetical protein [Methylobacterium organophilum]